MNKKLTLLAVSLSLISLNGCISLFGDEEAENTAAATATPANASAANVYIIDPNASSGDPYAVFGTGSTTATQTGTVQADTVQPVTVQPASVQPATVQSGTVNTAEETARAKRIEELKAELAREERISALKKELAELESRSAAMQGTTAAPAAAAAPASSGSSDTAAATAAVAGTGIAAAAAASSSGSTETAGAAAADDSGYLDLLVHYSDKTPAQICEDYEKDGAMIFREYVGKQGLRVSGTIHFSQNARPGITDVYIQDGKADVRFYDRWNGEQFKDGQQGSFKGKIDSIEKTPAGRCLIQLNPI